MKNEKRERFKLYRAGIRDGVHGRSEKSELVDYRRGYNDSKRLTDGLLDAFAREIGYEADPLDR